MSATWVALVGAAAAALAPREARANSRFPSAQYLVVGPGTDSTTIAVRTTFGIILSDDSGQTFHFLCEEAFQYVDGYDPSLALSNRGDILVAVSDGVLAMRDRCQASRIPSIQDQFVSDLTADPSGRVVFAAVNSPEVPSIGRIARSTDGAQTFHLPTAGLRNVGIATVEVAPSNANRVYVTATDDATQRQLFLRSDDAGETLRETGASLAGITEAYVSDVDPELPDTVYLRVRFAGTSGGDGGSGAPTALLRSTDAGEHFTEIARTMGAMRGFAVSGDGSRIWIGGPDPRDGVQLSENGGAFERVSDMPVDCLRYHGGALYACGVYERGGVMVARSTDSGRTMVPLVTYASILPPPTCPAGTIVQDICQGRWVQVRGFIDPGHATPDAGADVAMDAPRDVTRTGITLRGGGCGACAVGAGTHGPGSREVTHSAGLLFALAAWRRRRRAPR